MAERTADLDPLDAFRLDGRVAVVTGASSGLGARFAQVLDAAGANVVLAARRTERLEEVAAGLTNAPLVVGCDVTDPVDREMLVERAVSERGHLDILVNNAGVTHVSRALEESDEDFEWVLDVNLVAPYALSKLAVRAMLERELEAGGQRGVIVNVASVIGLVASVKIPQASYAASKAGLVNLTRELAGQWARKGIRVNALAPGFFASEMTEDMFSSERGQDFIARETPMARPGEAHELDGALLFLCSDASSYVTGQTIPVDGGWTIL